MNKENTNICNRNPRDEACDVVQYAEDLLTEEYEKEMKKVTRGEQKGFTKVTVEGILEQYRK